MEKIVPDDPRTQAILKRPYSWIFVREEGGFSASILEFPGCFAEGDTAEEAFRNLQDIATAWVQDQLDKGDPIPEPQPRLEYSGRFLLRISRSLHARAAQIAALENVSLNHFMSSAVAEKVARTETTAVASRVTIVVTQPAMYQPTSFAVPTLIRSLQTWGRPLNILWGGVPNFMLSSDLLQKPTGPTVHIVKPVEMQHG